MRDPERIDRMLKLLEAIWKANPDWRFGQLVCNVHPDMRKANPMLFHTRDENWEHALGHWAKRGAVPPRKPKPEPGED